MPPTPQDLIHIFNQLKPLLKKHTPPFQPKFDLDSKYDLWSFRKITVAGRPRKETYFAGLIIQSSYVGFYYMPVYLNKDTRRQLGDRLVKTLKGKSCFHIKELDKELTKEIEHALLIGKRLYKKLGYV